MRCNQNIQWIFNLKFIIVKFVINPLKKTLLNLDTAYHSCQFLKQSWRSCFVYLQDHGAVSKCHPVERQAHKNITMLSVSTIFIGCDAVISGSSSKSTWPHKVKVLNQCRMSQNPGLPPWRVSRGRFPELLQKEERMVGWVCSKQVLWGWLMEMCVLLWFFYLDIHSMILSHLANGYVHVQAHKQCR